MPIAHRSIWTAAAALLLAVTASAQTPLSGDVTIQADYLPNRNQTMELRGRVYAEEVLDPTPKLLIMFAGFAEGLLARRPVTSLAGGGDPLASTARLFEERRNRADAILRVQDLSVEFKDKRFELLAGITRVAWGTLDQLQPTDVVNPLDVSRFFFEGRSEARLPVGLLRARAILSKNASIEGIYVPFFRRARFDQLDESTSPFNLEAGLAPPPVACLAIGCPTLLPSAVERREPANTLGGAQGGARFSATSGRVDWSVSGYRGFEPFGLGRFAAVAPNAAVAPIEIVYPRVTMAGADFETVRGQWGVRGELAAFLEDSFQHPSVKIVGGSSVDAGLGVDRKAGSYRLSGTALFHRESYDQPIGADSGRADVSLIVSADRSFARERYQARTFGVYNTTEGSAFLRGIVSARLRDNLALEGSAGWFVGDGRDAIGRFGDSDFGYARVRFYY